MKEFLKYTFGGLKTSYLVRHFIFGLLIALFYFKILASNGQTLGLSTIALLTVNTLLYPYSRFVYESIMDFLLGNNQFFVNSIFYLIVKVITMVICWGLAIFIAPFGLAFIYYRQTKA